MILDIHSRIHNIAFGLNSINMKFSSSTITGLVAILLSGANADNTPNLCTDGIKDLIKIKPSEASGLVPPNITVGGFEYNGDAEHFVMGTTTSKHKNRVLVYLPGTTDRPELSSCLLKSVAATLPYPTIGLSYAYLSSGDKFRNGKCQLVGEEDGLPAQVDCLTQQHKDAIDGGTYGNTHFKEGKPFWDSVDPSNSITARLGFLLKHLDETIPNSGWDRLYDNDINPSFPTPKWGRLEFMGHSQGAGHAAYLGQTQNIQGAIMVSGPQDQCIGCPVNTSFWIDEDYTSKKYTAFASGVEPLVGVMQDNWNRMTDAGATTWTRTSPKGVGFAIDRDIDGKELAPCDGPLLTYIIPASTSTCGGKEHCSTAIDDSVPFIEKSNGSRKYLYENSVWPSIARVNKRCGR